ncbi:TlyA family RNA methyltransferase [Actinotalea sp. K2]|uniref:TlyA family RNA methyltransferase n=1 Tax=Actinotalea sp. K2 TaxID=2939438 RepID=UPI002016C217|nr:TlyA family RNA methyltransferase [Actinotalea sp. K2]MCL3861978.1 TlyA family RNA methyltransferase [Actinotalea sp. K2]
MPLPLQARLDSELVRRGLVTSRRRAAELVSDGRVLVAGEVARKPAQQVLDSVPLVVSDAAGEEYVSRAGHKLAGALDAVQVLAPGALVVQGRRCLDAGASTGGFTDVLLRRGAGHVLAVDVGHGQLVERIRQDPRVTAREGVNVRYLGVQDVPEPVDLLVADLSFISLLLVLAPLAAVTTPGGDLLLMVKPQFEVGRERLGADGVVTSPALRREAVLAVATAMDACGCPVRAVVPSALPGPAGNREYFLWASLLPDGGAPGRPERGEMLEAAVHDAVDRGAPALVGPDATSGTRST